MGRAYILNTKTGRDLKTYLGAKAKLKVSTRGEGVYLDGQTHNGYPVIDPDTYELQTVDFVLNPGFLETSANLTAQKESVNVKTQTQQVQEELQVAKKKGEQSMTLDMESYVQELKEELKSLKEENKSLAKELKEKDTQLLENKFTESAEIKKINEAYAPFKKLGVSAKALNENLKRSQDALAAEKEAKAKIAEELQQYKSRCASVEQLDEATEMSVKALNTISEYQKLGTVDQLKSILAESERILPQLKELKVLTEYKKLGTVDEIKQIAAKCESLASSEDSAMLESYKKIGTVEGLQELVKNSNVALRKLKEAHVLGETVKKLLPKLEQMEQLQEYAKKANSIIEQYVQTVGDIKKVKSLTESKKQETKQSIKKVNIKEALEISDKYGCAVESAAKLISKYGTQKASKLLESAVQAKEQKKEIKLAESKQLIEEAGKMDKVNANPESKDAKDFLKTGMITNAFNLEALGKKMDIKDINKINGEKVDGLNQAQQLLKAYKDKVEVEAAPKVDIAIPVTEAPVDPAYEEVKEYLKNK